MTLEFNRGDGFRDPPPAITTPSPEPPHFPFLEILLFGGAILLILHHIVVCQ